MSRYEITRSDEKGMEQYIHLLTVKNASQLFISRSLFEGVMKAKEGDKPYLTGYLTFLAENENSDVMKLTIPLPKYTNDGTKEGMQAIFAAIDKVELDRIKAIQKEITALSYPFDGIIEDRNKSVSASLSQIANSLNGMQTSLDTLNIILAEITKPKPEPEAPVIAEAEAATLSEEEAKKLEGQK